METIHKYGYFYVYLLALSSFPLALGRGCGREMKEPLAVRFTLYKRIKDRMNIRSQVDGRLPYTAPCAELFALAAGSPSLLVSFSANFDDEFDDSNWITDEVAADNSI